ncbi:MAG: hypothetical protein KKE11_03200 [Gammaproteobacteria bacterium]|nr:hypothetical protein [Gammaproteobacteria bacterium]
MKKDIIELTLDKQKVVCGGIFGGRGQGQGLGERKRSGRGRGRGAGLGQGQGLEKRQGPRQGLGLGGFCVCSRCGEKIIHQRGVPCFDVQCSTCNLPMVRE